jgi:hypothetical protein
VLSDLAAKEEDVQLCNQVATEAAMMFDRMEEEDGRLFLSPDCGDSQRRAKFAFPMRCNNARGFRAGILKANSALMQVFQHFPASADRTQYFILFTRELRGER